MQVQEQERRSALCAIALLLAVLLALSGVMLGGVALAGHSSWLGQRLSDVASGPPCGVRGATSMNARPPPAPRPPGPPAGMRY